MKRYYLAYGSNLHVEQMRHRCPGARVVGTAVIEGYRLMFKGSKTGSYLTIEPQEGYSVPVAVWSVTADDEQRLDFYEGFPTFYYKKEMPITYKGIESGKLRAVDAFVYIMHEDRLLGAPSSGYCHVCMEGYRTFGFDPQFLMDAFQYSITEGDTDEGK